MIKHHMMATNHDGPHAYAEADHCVPKLDDGTYESYPTLEHKVGGDGKVLGIKRRTLYVLVPLWAYF